MRKLTLELEPYGHIREELSPMFDVVHSYEILETLKTDYVEGVVVDLIECHLREELSIEDVDFIGRMEILSVLKSEGHRHICLVRYEEPDESMDLLKQFDLDLINTIPFSVSDERHVYSVIGPDATLRRYVGLLREHIGRVGKMTFKRAVYQRLDVLSTLTEKQREVLIAAHKWGYYEYPKKINSARLSKRVDLSQSTLLEHLRKAEGRLLDEILAGYS